jgi:hypothetical protein
LVVSEVNEDTFLDGSVSHCVIRSFLNFLTGEQGVNLTGIVWTLHSWFIWRFDLQLLKQLPVDVTEERMVHNVRGVVTAATQTFLGVSLKQLGQNHFGLRAEVIFHGNWLLHDVF